MALAHCILGKFLGVGWHCFPPPLDVPTFSARCLHVRRRERSLAAERGTLRGQEMFRQIPSTIRLPRNCRDLLRATNLRHGTDGFTSPPKEGVLRIFSPLKIRRLRPGLNPRTWVPKASTLPLDHRSRLRKHIQDHYFSWQYLFATSCWGHNHTKLGSLSGPTSHTYTYYQRQLARSVCIIIHNKYRIQGANVTNPRSKFFVDNFVGCLLKKQANAHSA
jgi:hypothetical protein